MENKAKSRISSGTEIVEFDFDKPFSDEENEAFFGDWKPLPQRLAEFQLTPKISTIDEFHARELACLAKTQVIELQPKPVQPVIAAISMPEMAPVPQQQPHEEMAVMFQSVTKKRRQRATGSVSAFVSNYHRDEPEQSSQGCLAGTLAVVLTVVVIGACALFQHQEQQPQTAQETTAEAAQTIAQQPAADQTQLIAYQPTSKTHRRHRRSSRM